MNSKGKKIIKKEHLAIVGIGCRLPGGINDPENFWNELCQGRDKITEVPGDRWDLKAYYDANREKPGKVYTKKGGFLEKISYFDPQFFGISPREASFMDPQQRLLLEVTWEALEDAGISPESLAGSHTGVFIGLFMHDFENVHNSITERNNIGPHSATGMSTTIAANRLSYVFDFKGPSMIIDTACSSSLVAVHLACKSLLSGESEIAVAGGVNILLKPEMTIALCKGAFLSEDGYCKSFDASADGYVRSEGAGVVIIKRLSDALAAHDPIYALIAGTAVNQDGKSEGLTVPDANAQMSVIRDALNNAGVLPSDIQYVEAHGTGTIVGDPIEVRALGSALSEGRKDGDHLVIGSVKSNLGHTESAAGVTSLIKTCLMLKKKKIPPNLHFVTPNPKIPFEALKLRVPTKLEDWPDTHGRPKMAGVNSFGFGGTNAHVVLLEYPENKTKRKTAAKSIRKAISSNKAFVVPISAHSRESLDAAVKSYIQWLDKEAFNNKIALSSIGHCASLRKGHHFFRLATVARSNEELSQLLEAYLDREKRTGIAYGQAKEKSHKPAFIFSGMGPQWWGMGRQLYQKEPLFKKTIEACAKAFARHTRKWNLLEELLADESASRINETQISQPCIFSVQAALHALWNSWGIKPKAITGHSVGEIAAYYAAGVLSLEDAVTVCYHRSRLQQLKAGHGGMLAVGISQREAEDLVRQFKDKVSIAAVNSHVSLTLAGDVPTLEAISALMEKENKFARFLKVEVPYHSYVMDSILDEFRQCLAGISPQAGSIPVVSTVTGQFIDGRKVNAEYWAQNVRQTVLFEAAFAHLIKNGFDTFIEISSHPVLKASMMECLDAQDRDGFVLSSLRRMEDEELSLWGALGQLYTIGYPIDWRLIYPDKTDFVRLPSYKWQRENYWRESEETMRTRMGWSSVLSDSLQDHQKHPLLGGRIKTAVFVWNSNIDLNHLPYLKDHVVQKSIVFPGAAYVEMALNAASDIYSEPEHSIENLEIKAPLILSEKPAIVQLVVREDRYFEIYGKQEPGGSDWTLHAKGRFGDSARKASGRISIEAIKARCRREKTRDDCYHEFAGRGLEYGEKFRIIESLRLGTNEALSEIRIHEEMEAEIDHYLLHPVILDAGFQTLASIQTDRTYLPVNLRGVRSFTKPAGRIFCHARLLEKTKNTISGTITLFNADGNVIADVDNLTCRLVRELRDTFDDNINKLLYEYEWKLDPKAAGNACRPLKTILPSPAEIAGRINPVLPELIQKYSRKRYYESVEPEFNRLCTAYIADAFHKLGFAPKKGDAFTTKALAANLGVIPEQIKVFGRFLEILAEDNLLRKEQNKWIVIHAEPNRDYRKLWNGIIKKYPEYHIELQLLDRCASRLAEILKGEEDPLSYIFSKSSPAIDQFYRNSPTMRIYNTLVLRTVGKIIDAIPKERTLRILEIGAGTGSLTSYLLPILPANRTQYFFTDISGSFTMQAQQRFKDYDFVEYKVLDIEKEPDIQGFDPHSFDVVLASDAIHATSRLSHTMANVKRLLAPSGLLIFIEQMKITRWFDLVFGLLSGWWLFSDHDIRPSYPLMPMNNWKKLLEKTGFTDITFTANKEEGFIPQHSIITASAPEKTEASVSQEFAAFHEMKHKQWIILADEMNVAQRLVSRLKKKGVQPVLVVQASSYNEKNPLHITLRADQPDQYSKMLDGICRDKDSAPVVVNMWSITKPHENIGVDFLENESTGVCMRTLYLMQSLIKRDWAESPSLWNITNGVQPVENVRKPAMEKSPVWGLNRVLISEHPGIMARMLDLSPAPDDCEIDFLCEQLLHEDNEDEIVIRGGRRYVHRLKRKDYPGFHEVTDIPFVVIKSPAKSPEGLHFFETTRRKPGRGEVEIKIAAAGVNFKDVALLTGLLDDSVLADKGALPPLGLECTGTIVAVGEGGKRFRIGDEVMGLGVNCFANYVTLDERVLARKPEKINFEDAATIPLAFLSAYYALNRSAKIQKGERVLIHTAAGGVGLAAVQVALAAGAEVLVTAGTPEKRDFLKSMGINYVGDSRTLNFAEEVMSFTNGEGVDVILNTLAENTLEKNMAVLKPVTGRFIDLSNIYRRSVRIYSLDKGIAYHTFDMDSMIKRYPLMAGDMLGEIAAGFAKDIYHPVPYTVFPVSELSSALGSMRKGLHTGKIIVSMTEPGVVPISTGRTVPVDSEGTYLLTGGMGGFGLAVAQWLADCGARNLVLVGRSGASTPEARDAIEKLKRQGVRVLVECLDISKEKNVNDLFGRMDDMMPSLKGVIHMAMVLEDSFLAEMNEIRMKKVMNPKILGAWNLHLNTLNKPLDFFICFSSFASLVGNTDQGNYVAANVFLDLLSTYRQNMNLPALTVCWGPIGDVGYVAQRSDIREHFRRQGFDEVGLDQAWQVISLGVRNRLDTVGIAPADWNTAARYNPSIGTSPRYSRLVKLSEQVRDTGQGASKIFIHSAMTAEERNEKLTDVLSKEVAGLLGLPASRLDISQSLAAIGFDSLMAVELVMRIEDVTGIKVPKMKLLKAGLSTKELVGLVEKEMLQAASADTVKPEEATLAKSDDIPQNVDALSDQEVDKLLMTLLSEQEGKNEK
jgi:acyl transferase domain-containing protein/NADPH:quinone reductase-like Zn-dependent oxidoreductase/acyl carrier protein